MGGFNDKAIFKVFSELIELSFQIRIGAKFQQNRLG